MNVGWKTKVSSELFYLTILQRVMNKENGFFPSEILVNYSGAGIFCVWGYWSAVSAFPLVLWAITITLNDLPAKLLIQNKNYSKWVPTVTTDTLIK